MGKICKLALVHAFAMRLVWCLLGHNAIAAHKCEVGMPLTILGVTVHILTEGMKLIPDRAKCRKWAESIRQALQNGRLTAGEAAKLAGRLGWASSACFKKAGRTLLYPIYRSRCHLGDSSPRSLLVLCLASVLGKQKAGLARSVEN